MKRSLSTLAAALLALYSISGCGDNRTVEDYLVAAERHVVQGDDAAAVIELKNALLLEPDNAAIRLSLGEVYLRQFQLAVAEKELQRAIELGEAQAAWWPLAQTLYHQQKMLELVDDIPADAQANGADQSKLDYLRVFAMLQLNRSGADQLVATMAQRDPEGPYTRLASALMLAHEQQNESALERVDEVLADHPDLSFALELHGRLAALQQEYERAIADFRKLVSLQPGNLYHKLVLAGLLVSQQEFDAARPLVAELLARFPNQAQINYYQAMLSYHDKELKLSAEHADRAIASYPGHTPARLLSAGAHYQLGQYEQANNALEPLAGRLPANHPARRLLAAIKMQLGDDEAALKALEGVGEFSPEDARLIGSLSLRLSRNGQYDEALTLLRKGMSSGDEHHLQELLGVTLIQAGDKQEGLRELEKLVAKQPESLKAQVTLVVAYLKAGEHVQALGRLDVLQKQFGDTDLLLSLRGGVLMSAGQLPQARENFLQALEQNPNNLAARLNLASVLMAEGNTVAAREQYKQALGASPLLIRALEGMLLTAANEQDLQENRQYLQSAIASRPNPNIRYLLAKTLFVMGEWNALVELYPKVLFQPLEAFYSPETFILLAQAYRQTDQATQAVAILRRWTELQPESALAHYYLGKEYLQRGELEHAETELSEAVRRNPEAAQAQLALANTRLMQGRLKAVTPIVERLADKLPNQPDFLLLKGRWQLAKGEPQAALTSFERLHQLAPSELSVGLLAQTYWLVGQDAAADTVLTDWIDAHPQATDVMMLLANSLLTRGKNAEALEWYQKVVKLQPENLIATNNLAWLLAERGELQQAREIIRPVVERWPEVADLLDTYGVILMKSESYTEAVKVLQSASGKAPQRPSIHFHYAQALMWVDRTEEARAILRQLLDTGETFPEREQARQLLLKGS